MDERRIDGGGDFRFFAYQKGKGQDKDLHPFLMEATFGLRYRPLRHTHLVYEARYFGPPIGQRIDTIPGQEKTRSLYVMQDDLPWNIFVMVVYKPLFGNYTPDHTALAQVMTSVATTGQKTARGPWQSRFSRGRTQRSLWQSALHHETSWGYPNEDESGIAGNFGLRFVTFGAQVNYSFWTTTDKADPNNDIKVEMHALEFRGAWRDYIFGIEAVSFARDEVLKDFREGGVITFEGKYKFWKENYATVEIARANTARTILPGSSRQVKVGSRHFLTPGLDLSFQYSIDNEVRDVNSETPVGLNIDQNTMSMMIHTYF